ncbi:MAG: CPBP family intramembrane metalloprotease [Proteobacteria bacterium]|nr:CPBP family intramembrane metalloprotease [Pseudomonadota bacterium]
MNPKWAIAMQDDMSKPFFSPARVSLWLLCLAMFLIIALKPDRVEWPHWNLVGWPVMAIGVLVSLFHHDKTWAKSCVLLAYSIVVLWFTAVDGDTGNTHIIELVIGLGIGILVVPALAAKYWLKKPLDYSWVNGRWSLKMWLWLPGGFILAFIILWIYFNILTPDLHHSWPLPLVGERSEAMWRLFWGCNFIGIWDELAWINFAFVLISRHFKFWEANLAQAVFFTVFLYDMAFVGAGPLIIFAFALIQGYTYHKTKSLLYILILHLMIDTILFYMIVNRWYPGIGWHPF